MRFGPTIDVSRYHKLPGHIRVEFDAWLREERLDDKLIVKLTLGEGRINVLRYDRDENGRHRVVDGELVVVEDTFPVRGLPPIDAFAGTPGQHP